MWALFYIDKVAYLHWKNVFVLTVHLVWFLNVLKKCFLFVIVVIVFHRISGIFQKKSFYCLLEKWSFEVEFEAKLHIRIFKFFSGSAYILPKDKYKETDGLFTGCFY